MKLKKLLAAYNTLSEAKVATCAEKEIIKIVKARKVMRPYVEEYEAYLKDCQDKFKPVGWDDVAAKLQQWQKEGEKTTLSEQEREEVSITAIAYQKSIDEALREELEKEVDLIFERLDEETGVKLISGNAWELKKLDDLEIMF